MNFLKNNWPVVLIVAFVVAVLAIVFVGMERDRKVFEELCTARGGTTVFDGRQYQCMKP